MALEGAELPVSLMCLGYLRRDGTPRATLLADPFWGLGWEGFWKFTEFTEM